MKKLIVSVFSLFTLTAVFAQEMEYMTPEQAVEILTGGGVEPFNIQFSGDPGQLGLLTERFPGCFVFASFIVFYLKNDFECVERTSFGID